MAKDKPEPAEELPGVDPKMRIRLLTENFGVFRDRLVAQNLELKNGPKEDYQGPYQIEFIISDQNDAELAAEYLKKLSGLLPLEKKAKKAKKAKPIESDRIEEFYQSLLDTDFSEDQEKLISFLRDQGFKFLTYQHIHDFGIPIEIREKDQGYQFMVRMLKQAKDPKNDKYDPQLAFGFKIMGEKTNKVVTYLYGKFKQKLEMEWPDKLTDINLKALRFLVFPEYMTEEERVKFSIEHRKLEANKELQPSKFYTRWKNHVKLR